MHLPFFAAVADGLFADHGLDVELVESAPGSQRVKQLAAGAGDFLLTAVLYSLQAIAEEGPLDIRFVGAVHQRSSVAALVRRDSGIRDAHDLAGVRLGGPQGPGGLGWLLRECCDDLARSGLGRPEVVPMTYRDAVAAMRDGSVDAVPNLAELAPLVARATGTSLRAITVGGPVYLSGLAAGPWVPPDAVHAMQQALRQTLLRQHEKPDRGVDLLQARYPDINADDAVASWSALDEYVIADGDPGQIDRDRWAESLGRIAATHALPHPSGLTAQESGNSRLLADRG